MKSSPRGTWASLIEHFRTQKFWKKANVFGFDTAKNWYDAENLHSNFNGAALAPKGRFGFLDVGPFWLHTEAKTELLGHFGPWQGYFGPNLSAILVL